MNANQKDVVKWWHSGRDYQQGVMLYARLGKNKMLMHTFIKKHERYGRRKLEYELTKSVGLDWKRMPGASKEKGAEVHSKTGSETITKTLAGKPAKSTVKTTVKAPVKQSVKASAQSSGGRSDSKTGKQDAGLKKITDGSKTIEAKTSGEPEKQYPKVIRRLKYEYSDLFNKRSLLHKRMRNIPAENSQQNMNSRAVLLRDIRDITGRLEFLYAFIDDYENRGVVPVSEEIWPAKEENQLSDDPQELKRIKKNLQSANTKDRNQLQYQQKSRSKKEKPMPEGPKRRRIEFRIKNREAQIEKIDQKLVDLENAD
jgi:hypothetical protein